MPGCNLQVLFLSCILMLAAWAMTLAGPYVDAHGVRERITALAETLARVGFEVDTQRFTVLVVADDVFRRAAGAERKKWACVDQALLISALRQGLGDWKGDQAASIGETPHRQEFAFYSPGTKTIFLNGVSMRGESEPAHWDLVLLHELIHVWRDQNLGLASLSSVECETLEQRFARHCLVEGEAHFVSTALWWFTLGLGEEKLKDAFLKDDSAAFVLASPSDLMYHSGASYAMQEWSLGGWAGVRDLFSKSIPSTEQLLHPKNLGGEIHASVAMPDWPADGFSLRLLREDCMGELGILQLLISAGVGPYQARIASAGWSGDRVQLLKDEDDVLSLLWRTVWDREEDALQFYEAIALRGDGECKVRGHIVDWARAVDGLLAQELLGAMDSVSLSMPIPEEGIGTAAVEMAWANALDQAPYIAGGRWVHPRGKFSLTVQSSWRSLSGTEVLYLRAHPDCFMTVSAALSEGGGAEMSGNHVSNLQHIGIKASVTVVELGGRPVVRVDYVSRKVMAASIAFASDDLHYEVRVQGPDSVCVQCLAGVDELFKSLQFEQGPPQGLGVPTAVDVKGIAPDLRQEMSLTVCDALTGAAIAGQDLWIVPYRAVASIEGPAEVERQAVILGRRYVTDDSGHARIAFREESQWVCARRPGLYGYAFMVAANGGKAVLYLAPECDVQVRLIGTDVVPCLAVPISLIYSQPSMMRGIVAARYNVQSNDALLSWSVLPGLQRPLLDSQLFVALDFPTASPVLERLLRCSESPVELRLPPLATVYIDFAVASRGEFIDAIGNARDDNSWYRTRRPPNDQVARARGAGTWLVGLNLELVVYVVDAFGRTRTVKISGPTTAGETAARMIEGRPR